MTRSKRRRFSRLLGAVIVLALVAGAFLAFWKMKSPMSGVVAEQATGVPDSTLAGTGERAESSSASLSGAREPAIVPLLVTTETPKAPAPAGGPAPSPAPARLQGSEPGSRSESGSAVSSTGNPIVDARGRLDAGDPVAARTILNDALLEGRLNSVDAGNARALLSQISRDTLLGPKVFRNDPFCTLYVVQPRETLQKIAEAHNITWELLSRINGIRDPAKLRAGQSIKLVKGPFHALVTKSRFSLEVFLGAPGGPGSVYVAGFPVGLGRDDSTPSGTWLVAPSKKLKNPTYFSPRGEGIIAADDPKNPLGEFWIGLAGMDASTSGKLSYGIHGTIDPDSIGREDSLGCIRLRNEDIALVFELLAEGKSKVVVRD